MVDATAGTGVPLIAPKFAFRTIGTSFAFQTLTLVVFRDTWCMVVPVEVTENLSDC